MGRNSSETESPYGHETGDQRAELEGLRRRLALEKGLNETSDAVDELLELNGQQEDMPEEIAA